MYALHKWYFDCLLPDGHHVHAYVADLTMAGYRACEGAACLSRVGSGTVLTDHQVLPVVAGSTPSAAGPVLQAGTLETDAAGARVDLRIGSFVFDLRFTAGSAWQCCVPRLEIPGRGGHAVRWTPLLPFASVSGRIAAGSVSLSVDQVPGYVDYMHSDLFPYLVPVRSLVWGRMHHPSADLTYSIAEGRRREEHWAIAVLREGSRVHALHDAQLRPSPGLTIVSGHMEHPREYSIDAIGAEARFSARVTRTQVAQSSDFLGDRDDAGRLKRRLLRAVARDPRGAKFFANASLRVDGPQGVVQVDNALLFDEHVTMG